MHRLKKKKGKKTVTHHFHHVKGKDGKKKAVYLGTSPKKAKDKLTKLRVERIRSDSRLIREMDAAQQKLNRLGHHNRPHGEILKDIRLKHNKQIHVERLLNSEVREVFPLYGYTLVFVAVMLITAGVFYVATTPTITGAAVEGAADIMTSKVAATAIGMLIVIVILGIILHHTEYRHRTRHDRYKHPKMLEK